MSSNPPKRRLRRLIVPAALIAAIVLAVMYLRCGGGLGLGGGSGIGIGDGTGSGPGAGPGSGTGSAKGALASHADVPRCQVRVTSTGIELEGKPATVAATVHACTAAKAADVIVTGDARQGAWDELKAALQRARVAVFSR